MQYDESPNRRTIPNTVDEIHALKIPSKWSDGTVAYHSLAFGMAEGFVQAFYLFEATQQLEIENLHEEGDRMSVSKFTLSEECFRELQSEVLASVRNPHPTLRGNNLASLSFQTPSGEQARIYCIISEQMVVRETPSGKGIADWTVLSVNIVPREEGVTSLKTSLWEETPFEEKKVVPPRDPVELKDFLEEKLEQLGLMARLNARYEVARDTTGDYVEIQDLPTKLKAYQLSRYIEKNFSDLVCDTYPYEYEDYPGITFWAVTVHYADPDSDNRYSF